MRGPGKYDSFCSATREATQATGVLLIVVGGNLGTGCSAQFPPELVPEIPRLLRAAADDIDRDTTEHPL